MNAHEAHFATRLEAAVLRTGTPVIAGIDPDIHQLPEAFKPESNSAAAWAPKVRAFCSEVLAAVADLVPLVKFQSAYFEQLGPAGVGVLGELMVEAKQRGLLVILDVKRGDIGSTSSAYAEAYLNPHALSGMGADAITLAPYMGTDSLQPFVDAAKKYGSGLFVCVKTSNPGSKDLQDQPLGSGELVYARVANFLRPLAESLTGASGWSSLGAVVGATFPQAAAELRGLLPRSTFLVPGIGAQQGEIASLKNFFDAEGRGALVSSSRAIIFPHRFKDKPAWSREAVRRAAADTITDVRQHVAIARP
ncbi:MAG TPA: orotidine-5'-phosphate decarboxylase [Polyangiaceae bacterium]